MKTREEYLELAALHYESARRSGQDAAALGLLAVELAKVAPAGPTMEWRDGVYQPVASTDYGRSDEERWAEMDKAAREAGFIDRFAKAKADDHKAYLARTDSAEGKYR